MWRLRKTSSGDWSLSVEDDLDSCEERKGGDSLVSPNPLQGNSLTWIGRRHLRRWELSSLVFSSGFRIPRPSRRIGCCCHHPLRILYLSLLICSLKLSSLIARRPDDYCLASRCRGFRCTFSKYSLFSPLNKILCSLRLIPYRKLSFDPLAPRSTTLAK